MIKVFISYSCGDQSHEAWVGQLADILEQDSDFHVTLDQYDLDRFKDKNKFMEDAVFDSDFMIVVATSDYKRKADTRTRGVGIESQLAAQRHYKESGESASSDIIVLAREPDSVPHYLSSKLYIDFIDDSKFNKSVKELINSLKGTALRKRPSKVDNNFINDLTRIEDILKIVYKKRSILIDKKSGTDFSNGNKIKYELWEVKTPKTEHILILYKNISIDDTFKRLKSETLKKNIIINSLTVIRIDNRQSAQVSKYLKIHFDKVNLTELTLKHFITDYCIDYDYTSRHEVWEEPYFIDQLIYSIDPQDSKELAIPLLMEKIKSPTNSSAHVIIAEGGDGKSSLCSSLVNQINSKPQEFDKSAILLRVDEIRNRISTDIISSFSIKNIYDIYNLFSQLLVDERGPASYPKISSNDFEVRVFSGSLVVIIDGLDELYSIFQDKFEKKEFLESLQSLNDQLGESSVILTSRGNIFSEISNYKDTLDIYYLKGFNRKECASYFTKRFRGEDNKTKIISQCNRDVSELMEATKVEKISPFVVDLISHSNTELPPEENDEDDIDYISSKKTYPSNSEFTDKIVYQILVREELRQNVHISIQEVVNLFCEIASEYGSSISEDKLREMCAIYYESQSNSVYDNLIANPLLLSERGVVTFRYHFLHDYFLTLYIIDGLLNKKTDLHFIKAISKYAKGSTSAYLDILNYFKNHNEINFPHILNKLKQVYNEKEGKHLERSISFVIHLMIDLHEKNPSKSDISKTILDNFTISKNNQMIENLFIYGDTLPLDFSHHIFRKCGFYSYPSFENCNFEHAFFSYSTVDIDIDNFKNKTINSQTFDSTCQTGKLSKYLSNHEGSNAQSEAGKDENLKRFFRNFMSQNSFVDIDLEELIFPTEQLSDRSPFFREAISQRIIYLNDENHCGISNLYRKPVQNYITNGVMDQKIYKVLVKL